MSLFGSPAQRSSPFSFTPHQSSNSSSPPFGSTTQPTSNNNNSSSNPSIHPPANNNLFQNTTPHASLTPQPNQPNPTLFGNLAQSKPSSSLFANNSNPSQPFGIPSNPTFQSTTPQANHNLFGNLNPQLPNSPNPNQLPPSTNLNLLGSSTSKSSHNLFNPSNLGNLTNSSSPAHPPSLFSSTNITNPSIFNRSAPPSTNTIMTPNGVSSLRSSTAQLYRRPISLSELSIQDRILKIHASWNVHDPQCQFQYFFYNVVPPEQVHLYGKPDQITADDPRWQRAKRNNPDPTRLVPTLAVGFEDLTKRVSVQQRQAQIHLSRLEEISSRLNQITRKHNLETSSRLHKLKTEQVKLSARLMGLVNKLNGIALHSSLSSGTLGSVSQSSYHHHQQQQLVMTRNSSKEEELIGRIGGIKADLEQFGGKSKIAELWSTLHQIKNLGGLFVHTHSNAATHTASHPHHHHPQTVGHHSLGHHPHTFSNAPLGHPHHPNGSIGGSGGPSFVGLSFADAGAGKWSVTDEKEIKKVLEILVHQKKGIDHLVLLLRRSRADLMLMRQAFNLESNLKTIEW